MFILFSVITMKKIHRKIQIELSSFQILKDFSALWAFYYFFKIKCIVCT